MNFIKSLFTNKKLRKQLVATILFLILFRFLSYVPIPWVDANALRTLTDNPSFDLIGLFSGGALSGFTIMATGISSYITASIIIQLLTYSIPKMYELSRSPGSEKAIKKITIALGIVLSIITSLGMTTLLDNNYNFLLKNDWYIYILIAIIHSIGTGIAIYIGETITDIGIGNGVSLLIFTNIVSQLPQKAIGLKNSPLYTIEQKISLMIIIATMGILIILLELSEKRIQVQYAKSIINNKTGIIQPSFIPLKLNINGVMPIIFSSSIIQTLTIIGELINNEKYNNFLDTIQAGTLYNVIITTILIFIFSFFYSSLIFNPKEIAENLQKSGGLIKNVRPGKATARYIQREGKEVTLINAIFLAGLTLISMVLLTRLGFESIGVTTIMILISVSIELYFDIKLETDLTKNTIVINDIMK